ncbi:hypothetical protein GCM10020000_36610 [Streptomyces olivoverticillatus]
MGMREVDRDMVEAARGMGMTGRQVMARVELPLAFPLIVTGVRSAAVQVVATTTLAALPGGGGLGRIITAGFRLTDTAQVVAGGAAGGRARAAGRGRVHPRAEAAGPAAPPGCRVMPRAGDDGLSAGSPPGCMSAG